MILSMRTGMRPRDGPCAVRSAHHLHGVTLHLNVSRPLPATLAYADDYTLRRRNVGSICFVNSMLASQRCAGIAQSGKHWIHKALAPKSTLGFLDVSQRRWKRA